MEARPFFPRITAIEKAEAEAKAKKEAEAKKKAEEKAKQEDEEVLSLQALELYRTADNLVYRVFSHTLFLSLIPILSVMESVVMFTTFFSSVSTSLDSSSSFVYRCV